MITIYLFYLLVVLYEDLGMDVALMALGIGLIIASFEIHFRYLEIAKRYYDKQLDTLSTELEQFLVQKKPSEKDQTQLRDFLKGLNKILTNFSDEREIANSPNHLLYGFLGMGIYAIFISFFYDKILFYYNNPPTPNTNTNVLIICLLLVALLPGGFILRGLGSLRKITRIV